MNRRVLLLIVIAGALAIASSWFSQRQEQQRATPEFGADEPDYYISRFTTTTMGVDGRPRERLQAQRLAHYPDDRTELTDPELTLFEGAEPAWTLTAERGRITPGGAQVHLEERVRLNGREGENLQGSTEWLTIDPENRYAHTEAPVEITRPGSRITARGMQVFLPQQRVVLLSNVRGVHEPPTP